MDIEQLIIVITAVVTYICGVFAKKFNWIPSKYIPIQNLVIGIMVSISYYFLIDNSDILNAVIMAFSGLISGGMYDLVNVKKEEE